MNAADGHGALEFGDFRLEPQRRLLSRSNGEPVIVTDKAFDALLYLTRHAGRLITKDELIKALWPDTVVEENNLYVAISSLRRALGADSAGERTIVTVAGRGYQFVAPVRVVGEGEIKESPEPVVQAPRSPPRKFSTVRWALLGAALVVAIGLTFIASRSGPDRAPVVTLAVLPFKPLTAGDRNESLELGMAETLIAGLDDKRLSVSPLSSVRRFAGSDQNGLAAGRELGVQAVLEGHIQRVGDKLRVSTRLLNVEDGRQLWAEKYDEAFTDIFSVQDAIAARVHSALVAELTGEEPPALRRYTNDSEAYQLYANGRFHMQRLTETDIREALADFEAAVARDPEFALAQVGIAEASSILGVFGIVAPVEAFPRARLAVDRALQIAPDLGEAYASLGHIKAQYELDWAGAELAYRRAIELNPNYAPAAQWYGLLLGTRGRFNESVAQLRRAQELEPAAPGSSALIGMVLLYQRRYDEAVEQLRLTLEMDPNFATTNTYLAAAYLRRGDFAKALEHLDRAKSSTPGSAGYRGQIYALSGRQAEAAQEVERLVALSKQRYVPAYDIATIYAALGRDEEALDWLERALAEHSQLIGWLRWDPVFDHIRSSSRYAQLAKRLG